MSGLIPRLPTQCSVTCSMDSDRKLGSLGSLVPGPSITANTVEGLVKLLRRMTSGRRWEAWLIAWPSTVLAVIEGLGTVIHFLPTAKKLDFLSNFTSLSSLFLSE